MKIKTELYEIDIHKKQLKYDFLFIALIFGTTLTFNMLKKMINLVLLESQS